MSLSDMCLLDEYECYLELATLSDINPKLFEKTILKMDISEIKQTFKTFRDIALYTKYKYDTITNNIKEEFYNTDECKKINIRNCNIFFYSYIISAFNETILQDQEKIDSYTQNMLNYKNRYLNFALTYLKHLQSINRHDYISIILEKQVKDMQDMFDYFYILSQMIRPNDSLEYKIPENLINPHLQLFLGLTRTIEEIRGSF